MEQRHRLLREQLDRDIAGSKTQWEAGEAGEAGAAAVAGASPSAAGVGKLSWTPEQRAAVERDVDLGLGHHLPAPVRQSIVSSCLVQQIAVDRAFDKLIMLGKDGSKAALLKRMREACRESFGDLLAASKSVGRMRGHGHDASGAHHAAAGETPPAAALLEEMDALCNNIDLRMQRQRDIASGALQQQQERPAESGADATATPKPGGTRAATRSARGRQAATRSAELAEARRRLQAACYSGVPGGASAQLRKIFRWMDVDRSGGLGAEEFLKLVRRHLKLQHSDFSDATARTLFDHVDGLGSNDGNVTLEELEAFLAETQPKHRLHRQDEPLARASTTTSTAAAGAAHTPAPAPVPTPVRGSMAPPALPVPWPDHGTATATAGDGQVAAATTTAAAPDPDAEEVFAIFEKLNTATPVAGDATVAEGDSGRGGYDASAPGATTDGGTDAGVSTGQAAGDDDTAPFSDVDLGQPATSKQHPDPVATPTSTGATADGGGGGGGGGDGGGGGTQRKKKKKKDKKDKAKKKDKGVVEGAGGESVTRSATKMLSSAANAFGSLWK